MRFNILLGLTLLTVIASFSSASARLERRRLSELSELELRDDGSLGEVAYSVLERRAKVTAAAAASRKATARAAATKNGKGTTAKGTPKTTKASTSQAAANGRKATKKATGQAKFGAAAAAHKATTNLPGRKQQFKVPGGGPTHSGKDARKAVFASHMEREANKSKSKTQQKKSPLKAFGNSDHRQPHAGKPHDKKTINHMKGPGHEFPIGDPVNKGPSRVITQETAAGHTKFKGVVAHDVTRPAGSVGYNDHFQVRPKGSRK